jgi:hypothetical protein
MMLIQSEIREELKSEDRSFTEIAKIVGERWQVLPARVKESCETQANSAKERFYGEMAEYKKTAFYAEYQEYLADFRMKHGPARSGECKLCHIAFLIF